MVLYIGVIIMAKKKSYDAEILDQIALSIVEPLQGWNKKLEKITVDWLKDHDPYYKKKTKKKHDLEYHYHTKDQYINIKRKEIPLSNSKFSSKRFPILYYFEIPMNNPFSDNW